MAEEFAWLEALESQVREAVERLGQLHDENAALREQVAQLRRRAEEPELPFGGEAHPGATAEEIEVLRGRIEELEVALAEAQADRREALAGAERYAEEREEIRRRVESLTRRLEGLAEGR
jgi:uncharacterized coiled-coil DUF342 family protein